jgi:DNA-binding NarL/FixJ family response regulator
MEQASGERLRVCFSGVAKVCGRCPAAGLCRIALLFLLFWYSSPGTAAVGSRAYFVIENGGSIPAVNGAEVSHSLDQKVRVFVVDDHPLFRNGLAAILRSQPCFQVLGESSDLDRVVGQLRTIDPDILLLDHQLPGMGVRDFLGLRPAAFRGKILLVTATTDSSEVARLIQAGVNGALWKGSVFERLLDAIRHVIMGELWIDQCYLIDFIKDAAFAGFQRNALVKNQDAIRGAISGMGNEEIAPTRITIADFEDLRRSTLTNREQAILRGVCHGMSNKEIAFELRITESGVKAGLQRLFHKYGVRTRSQLAVSITPRVSRP